MRSVEHLLLAAVVRADNLLWVGDMFQSGACGEAEKLLKWNTKVCGEQVFFGTNNHFNGEGIGGGLYVSNSFSSSDGHMMQYQPGRRRKLMRTMLPEKASVLPVICSPVLERKACRQLLLKLNNMRETDCEQRRKGANGFDGRVLAL